MKQLSVLLFALLFSLTLFSQNDKRLAPLPLDLDKIEILDLEPVNNKALIKAELERRKPGRPNYFAHTFEVNVAAEEKGSWTTLPDGSSVWRLRVFSENAKSLNFGFSKFKLPTDGTLVIYSPDMKKILGPFTPADNEDHNQLWTPVIDGDDLIIEVWLKQNNKSNLDLTLKSVNHDFIGINSASFMSGSCNLDVICTLADGWGIVDGYRDIIQSVAFMHLNGNANCTGFLVNNTAQDCTPLFMTADHCGMSAGNAPSLVTYWNFQNSTCRQPNSAASGGQGDGMLNDFNSGSVMRASWGQSDFTIVELDDPVSPSAKAYNAGWNAADTLASSVIAVHHPNNDEKRISFENDPVYLGDWSSAGANVPNGDHVIVEDWDIGTTEPGSSGSPLFDQNKRIIGQLHGGGAACGNNDYDSYGWFNASWEGGGTANTRLKDWIDPIGSGTMILDGKDCGFAVEPAQSVTSICAPDDAVYQMTVSENFLMNVTLTIADLPAGFTSAFSNNNPAPGETVTLTISNTSGQPYGYYPFTVNGTDGIESSVTNLFLELFDDVATIPTLMTPVNMATEIVTTPLLGWATSNASTYELEIATDANFANLVYSNNSITTTDQNVNSNLESVTTYFWRVRGNNLCGTSAWSAVNTFTTADIVCSSLAAADLPIAISPNGTSTITSTLTVLPDGQISDINVINIQGTHSWIADLVFTLESPEGTSVILISQACDSEDDFSISFDDQATGNFPCPYNDGGTYPPIGALSAFNGENPQGVWTLSVEDVFDSDGGSLDNWGLEICSPPDNSVGISPSVPEIELCTGNTTTFDVYIGGGMVAPVSLLHTALDGATVTFNPVDPLPGESATATLTIDNNATAGNQILELIASDATTTVSSELPLNILAEPVASELQIPADGTTDVSDSPTFSWTNPGNLDGLNVQISTDPTFNSNIVVNASLPTASTVYTYTNMLLGATTYYWQVTTENSCGTTTSQTSSFITETVTSIENLGDQYFELLPNPSKGDLNIRLAHPIGQPLYGEILHVNGMVVANFEILSGKTVHELSLGNFPSGIYVVRLRNDLFLGTRKVVKE